MENAGLVVISVTDEDSALVDAWVLKNNVTHPVVILEDGKLEGLVMGTGFPSAGVFENGELAWTGHPSSAGGAIETALKSADKGSVYPKKLKKVRGLMQSGDFSKALTELRKMQEKGLEGRDKVWAERLGAYMEQCCDRDFAKAKEAVEGGRVYDAVTVMTGYIGKASPFPQALKVSEWLVAMEEDPNYKKEMAGGALYAEGVALESQDLFVDAFKIYKKAAKKGKGARIEQVAIDAAGVLLMERHTGYKASCPSCTKSTKSACAKHFEDLKL